MYFNRFDIVEAHYTYCVDYHSGQFSDLYKKLCKITKYFTPSPMFKGYESLDPIESYTYLVKVAQKVLDLQKNFMMQ
jgi:hypothetical protein